MAKFNIGFTITGDVWVDEDFLRAYEDDIYGTTDLSWAIDDLKVSTETGFNLDYQVDEAVILETI